MHHRLSWCLIGIAAVVLGVARPGAAQDATRPATLSGMVVDSLGQPIGGADVALPGLALSTRTNEWGGFRIANIPPGTHRVTVRRVGFGALETELEFGAGALVQRRIELYRTQILEEIVVVAESRDVRMEEFEANRRVGLGTFITREQLERMRGSPMSSVLAQVGGAELQRGTGSYAWMARRRGPTSLVTSGADGRWVSVEDRLRGAKGACYSNVYLDNLLVYSGRRNEALFNVNSVSPDQIEAIEFYAGPAQTPLRYSTLNSVCGVLVIHTRRYSGKEPP
jgi:hypothetical protein